jgi:hypothetical protein
MKDRIEIYCQPGKFGIHAGGRYPCVVWAAHHDDEETAAWRCALKHWFPTRPNGVLLYPEARAITVNEIAPHTFEALLELQEPLDKRLRFARDISPLLAMEGLPTQAQARETLRTQRKAARTKTKAKKDAKPAKSMKKASRK